MIDDIDFFENEERSRAWRRGNDAYYQNTDCPYKVSEHIRLWQLGYRYAQYQQLVNET